MPWLWFGVGMVLALLRLLPEIEVYVNVVGKDKPQTMANWHQ